METLKLELEKPHVLPYAPYELKGKYDDSDTILTLDLEDANILENRFGLHHFIGEGCCKLLLHPLSDLTKPIWNNTEEFVPLEKFYEILDCRTAINENDVRIDIDTIIKHGIEVDTDWIYVKKFYEWKIVVDIPEHLWIDINTLEENPYK